MALPKLLPWPGQKLTTPSGRPASSRSSKNFAAMVGESLEGLQDDRVATHDGGQRHAAHDGAGKIPRRNHHAHAQRNVTQPAALARQLHGRPGVGEAKRFQGVEIAEVNQFSDVAIGLGPVFADLEDHPRHQLELALAQQYAHPEQQVGAFLDGGDFQVSNAFKAACIAGSTSLAPAAW